MKYCGKWNGIAIARRCWQSIGLTFLATETYTRLDHIT